MPTLPFHSGRASSRVLEPWTLLETLNGFFYGPALFGALDIVVWDEIALQRRKAKKCRLPKLEVQ